MSTIHFKTVEYKNFMAAGNASIKIQLNKSKTTLIVGKNGSGKSSMVEAICYALFGKPYRDIKLSQLINSINNKQCLVTLEFDIGSKQYKVVRGMKPSVFEIYENGELINQESASKDYQKILENQILRLNYKVFTQVVILGSASFTPFMQLKAAQRREMVEDILDIKIFSNMNQLLKDRISSTKSKLLTVNNDLTSLKQKITHQEKIISLLEQVKDDQIASINSTIETNLNDISVLNTDADGLRLEIESLQDKIKNKKTIDDDIKRLVSMTSSYQSNISKQEKHIHFFNDNDVCYTCSQQITADYKQEIISTINADIESDKNNIQVLEVAYQKLNEKMNQINSVLSEISDKNIKLSTKLSAISLLQNRNNALMAERESVNTNNTDVNNEKEALKTMATSAISLVKEKNQLSEEKAIQDVVTVLLKDTGIKTAIIKEYLPVMNQLINRYLGIMDTYIRFELDDTFNETIKSRYRDAFTYPLFSEGEKKRIDIAILFAWRAIAKMKNSVNTNLLIMDETMDSAVDDSGLEYLMQIIDEASKDTNIFVISHRGEPLQDKFHSILRLEKKNDFSVIV